MNNRKKTVYITRKEHFNAAHKLYNPKWSAAENEAFFGKCANKNYHGHNFDLYVTVKGVAHEDTGMVMDLKKLKSIFEKHNIIILEYYIIICVNATKKNRVIVNYVFIN